MGFDIARSLGKIPKDQRQKTAIVTEPQPMTAHFEDVKGDPNGAVWDEHMRLKGFGVSFAAIDPDDLAELNRKATAYNELKAVIDRLDCEIQDLKKLFV